MLATNTNGNITATQSGPTDGQLPEGLKADIMLLRSLLKDDALTADPDGGDEPGLEELLKKLETADGIARGMESRLDGIIDSLDGLLESLEAQTEEVEATRLDSTAVVEDASGVIVQESHEEIIAVVSSSKTQA